MTDTAQVDHVDTAAPPAPRRRRRRLFVLAAVVVLVLAAGIVTATVWVRHYSAAPGLDNAGGELGWLDPTARPTDRTITVGGYDIFQTYVRQGETRGFVVWVHNPSSVTQTITGLRYPRSAADSGEPTRLLISDREPGRPGGPARYLPAPVAVPPGAFRALHVYVTENVCVPGRSITFDQLDLTVRVGAFDRFETITFGDHTGFVLTGAKRGC
ncbi:hypothetical protein [Jatrophihabitans fulvus]